MVQRPRAAQRVHQSILSKALGRPPATLGFVDVPEATRSNASPGGFVEDGIAAWGQLLGVAGASSAALSTAELLSGASWRAHIRRQGRVSVAMKKSPLVARSRSPLVAR